MALSSNVLALLIALISVVSLALPGFLALRHNERADIRAAYLGAVGSKLRLLMTNYGNRPAYVGASVIGTSDEITALRGADQIPVVEIQPNQTKMITYQLRKDNFASLIRAVKAADADPKQLAYYRGKKTEHTIMVSALTPIAYHDASRKVFTTFLIVTCNDTTCWFRDQGDYRNRYPERVEPMCDDGCEISGDPAESEKYDKILDNLVLDQ